MRPITVLDGSTAARFRDGLTALPDRRVSTGSGPEPRSTPPRQRSCASTSTGSTTSTKSSATRSATASWSSSHGASNNASEPKTFSSGWRRRIRHLYKGRQ